MNWQEDYSHDLFVFGSPQRELVRGQGVHVWDSDGKEYIDLLAGIAVNVLGHAHPTLVHAVSTQLATLGHVSNYFTSPPQLALAATLKKLADAPADTRVFFANSGTEANEAAIKLALRHRPGGRLVALEGSFHGRTLGALSLTSKHAYRDPYTPMTGNVAFVPPGDLAALTAVLDDGDIAAVFIEMIQGEAGVRPLDHDYVRALAHAAHQAGALVVVDEVQTGVGRTGQWLAHTGVITPDVVTMAKGLAGGIPIGAVMARGDVADLLAPGQHGTTFGGNPIATAAGLAVAQEVQALLPHVRRISTQWRTQLAAVPGVIEVRGAGLLLGVELDRPSSAVQSALLDAGFITNAVTPTALRLAPPLIINREQTSAFTAALAGILQGVES